MQAKSASNIKVIDVSHHQGSINWPKVKAAGVQGAFIKATEGKTGIDLKFAANASAAVAAGLKVGYYHYARPENNSPEDEAAQFYRNVKGLPVDFPYVLDIEGAPAAKLGADALTVWCVLWLKAVEKLSGHPTMVYTGAAFAKDNLRVALGKWPLWVAHYDVEKPMDNPTWREWAAFQYTSSSSVDGIVGNVDVNAMELAFFNRYTGVAALPEEIVPKVVKDDKMVVTGELIDGKIHAPIADVLRALGVPFHWDNETKKLYV